MVGSDHANMYDQGRAEYHSATDEEVLAAMKLLTHTEEASFQPWKVPMQ